MSVRLSIVSTRTGDAGETGLADKTRLPKYATRIVALGEIDTLNSAIGLWRSVGLPADVDGLLQTVQQDLFDLGGELSLPGRETFAQASVHALDQALEHYNAGLPPLKEFILPGGCPAAAHAHMARAFARQAERALVSLAAEGPVGAPVLQYLNRLSDMFFVLARYLNQQASQTDVFWHGPDA